MKLGVMTLARRFIALILLCFRSECGTLEVKGAGASFPVNVYTAWMSAYKAHRGPFATIKMTYESIGSGGGISRMTGQTGPPVDYGASDSVMTDETYQLNPDLQMIPSMAGAIVLAYNIPGVLQLNLTLDLLVDIYMGVTTHWNDPRIQVINPDIELPNKTIAVIARADKSGTTEMFTRALSAHSNRWKDTYGVFNKGIDTDYKPYHWNPDVVTLFGNTNRGISGLVLSQHFSISYLSLSESKAAKLQHASLQNMAGNFVKPDVDSVQSAMNDFQQSFDQRMTIYLLNPPGRHSYPLVGYTYLIIRMTGMADCRTAEELIRYILWFYTNRVALDVCIQRDLVPLSSRMVELVLEKVIKVITCRRDNVYGMVLRRRALEAESLENESWRLPIIASTTVFGLLMILLLLYLVRHQIVINKGLLRHEWRIDLADIVIVKSNQEHHVTSANKDDNLSISAISTPSYSNTNYSSSGGGGSNNSKCLAREGGATLAVPPHQPTHTRHKNSSCPMNVIVDDYDNDDGADHSGLHGNNDDATQASALPSKMNSMSGLSLPSLSATSIASTSSKWCQTARWKSTPVLLCCLCFKRLEMTFSKKRKVLWLRDLVNHPNICRFYGITFYDGTTSVYDYCSRGSLETILYDQKHTFNVQGKMAIAKEIAKGMEYLHKMNIVHSGLQASRCLVDDRWMLKIVDWEVTSLVGDITARDEEGQEDMDWSDLLFWTAPEIIRFRFKTTKNSDVYSFAMVMMEIFLQGCPFKGGNSGSDHHQPKDVIEAITVNAWRPPYPQSMPISVRGIVDRCWEMDPMARPTFARLTTLLKSVDPASRGVMHCLMDTLTDQNAHLDRQLQEKAMESEQREKQLEMVLAQTCPRYVAQQLATGQPIRTTYVKNVTVMATSLHNFPQLLQSLVHGMAIDLLCQILSHLNDLMNDLDCFRVDSLPGHIYVVTGLGQESLHHADTTAVLAVDWLNYLKGVSAACATNLVFTVALCSGPVYTGIADVKSPRFLIIGETMRQAQELTSLPDSARIPLSKTTFDCLQVLPGFLTLSSPSDGKHENPNGTSYFLLGLNDTASASLSKQSRLTSHRP